MTKTPSPDDLNQFLAEALAREAEDAQRAGAVGYMARALVQCTLPHSKVAGNEFVRRNGNYTLSLMAPSHIGLPYGAVPRLLMCWVTSEAVRTQSRELILGPSLSDFMRQIDMTPPRGRPSGGRWGSIPRLKDQTRRLFNSTITTSRRDASGTHDVGFRIADDHTTWWDPKDPQQTALWRSTVTLSEKFYQHMTTRPVPIDLRALKCLKKSPLALDAYVWLTYRMSWLEEPIEISWDRLVLQFGSDYARLCDFKKAFLGELRKVRTVYPEALVEPREEGLLLKPSRTHVPKRGSG